MKKILLLAILGLCISCNQDVLETFPKKGYFTITKLKTGGKRAYRGFYIDRIDQKVHFRSVRNGQYLVGDIVELSYDSIVNRSKGTYELKNPKRLTNEPTVSQE